MCRRGLNETKMSTWKIAAAALLFPAWSFAQDYTLSGNASDLRTRVGLVGATLQLVEAERYALTNELGDYRFDRIRAGEYTLVIRYVGYEEETEHVTVAGNTIADVAMTESVIVTDEVIVFATRANQNTPTTYTNIGAQALRSQNFGQDMPMLLNWTPSVVTTSDAGAGIGYTGIRIRGSDATRINVTINGISYNDSESQGTFWVDIPDIASSTQSVQIQRGVGTSTNGAGAFGGTVNVQTLTEQRDAYAEALLGAGSFNTQRYTLKAGTGVINKRWSFDGRVSRITSDGYIDRASSDLSSYYLSAGYRNGKTIVKAITFGGNEKTYQAWNGVDAATLASDRTFNSAGAIYDASGNVSRYYDNEVDDYRQDHYQLHLTHQVSHDWNANMSLHYTRGCGFYEQFKQASNFADFGLPDVIIGDSTVTSSDLIVRKWLDNRFYGGTFAFNYEKEKLAVSFGGAYSQYAKAKHFGEIIWGQILLQANVRDHYYDGKSEKDDFNAYVKTNYQLSPAINLFADLQVRRVYYETGGISDDQAFYFYKSSFTFFNPKAGLSYVVSGSDVLHVSYAIANREPNRTDYLGGIETPLSERLGNLEAGWRRNSKTLAVEANYYLMNYRDQLVLTGALDNVGNPIRANVGKSYRTGVELSGVVRLSSKVLWNANATWSVNRNVDYAYVDENNAQVVRNTSIIMSPNWIAGSQLSWTAFANFQVALLTKFVGRQYLDNTQNESLTLDPYLVNDIRFNYAFQPKGMKGVELSVLINNVLDTEYESNGAAYGPYAYFYPQAGRNFMAMMSLRF